MGESYKCARRPIEPVGRPRGRWRALWSAFELNGWSAWTRLVHRIVLRVAARRGFAASAQASKRFTYAERVTDPEHRQPQHLERTAEDSVDVSESVNRTVNLSRSAADQVEMAESVESRVAQAQALIATARGDAHDARVRVEEFAAAATTPAERDAAAEVLAKLEAVESRLSSIETTVNGIRADATKSEKTASRYNWTQVAIGIGGIVIGVVFALLLR